MTPRQNILERILDRMEQGLITAAEGNVELVMAERFWLVQGRLPREVRKALQGAVKEGRICRMPKDGLLPEAFHHPDFGFMAAEARRKVAVAGIEGLKAVLTRNIP